MAPLEDLFGSALGDSQQVVPEDSQQVVPEDSQPPSPKASTESTLVVIEDTPDKAPLTHSDSSKGDDDEIRKMCSPMAASRAEIENKISELTSKLCDAKKLQASQTLSFEIHPSLQQQHFLW